MKEELKHIFDESVCLSSRQLKDYVAGHMSNEECHAIEHHLNSCPLCSAAVDGMLLQPEKALETISQFNTDFLREHLGLKNSQPQANSNNANNAPTSQVADEQEARAATPVIPIPKFNVRSLIRPVSIAAALVLIFVLVWYLRPDSKDARNGVIAQKLDNEQSTKTSQNELRDEPVLPAGNAAAPAPAPSPAPQSQPEVQEGSKALVATGAADNLGNEKTADKIADTKKAAPEAKIPSPAAGPAQAIATKKTLAETKKDAVTAKNQVANAVKQAKTPAKDDHKTIEQVAVAKNDQAGYKTASDNNSNVHAFSQPATAIASRSEAAAPSKSADAGTGAAAEQLPSDRQDRGKYYFNQQKYGEALKEYKNDINSSSKSKRHEATYMAAQCYIKLGNTKEAERLLKIIVDEGGSQKRHAKKLLESLAPKTEQGK
ncbi:MAG: tetratricopeptide repeat protein [Bacteroidetes bacterium]|nr:tetratricopeptide repeat protein [Bacteroidota bacterium]